MTISIIKRHDLGGYEKIITCKSYSCRVWNICAFSYNTNRYIYSPISIEKVVSPNNYQKYHIQTLFALLKQRYLFSCPKFFGQRHTSAPDIKDVLSSPVFLTRSIGSIQSSVEENPHHISAFIEISWQNSQNSLLFLKTLPIPFLKKPCLTKIAPPRKTTSRASTAAASKGKSMAAEGTGPTNPHPSRHDVLIKNVREARSSPLLYQGQRPTCRSPTCQPRASFSKCSSAFKGSWMSSEWNSSRSRESHPKKRRVNSCSNQLLTQIEILRKSQFTTDQGWKGLVSSVTPSHRENHSCRKQPEAWDSTLRVTKNTPRILSPAWFKRFLTSS